jgi:PAS domain S-box-containing protein
MDAVGKQLAVSRFLALDVFARHLGVRVAVLVGGAMAFLLAVTLLVCAIVLDESFGALQDRLADVSMRRLGRAMDQLAAAQCRLVRDSAEWDDSYAFLAGENSGFLARNYGPDVDTSGQDAILFYNARRELVGAVQPRDSARAYEPPAGFVAGSFLAPEPICGLERVGDRIWLVSASRVHRTDGSGPSNGWLVYGTVFTPKRLADFAETAGVAAVGFSTGAPPLANKARVEFSTPMLGALVGFFQPARSWKPGRPYPPAWLRLPAAPGRPGIWLTAKLEIPVYERALRAGEWMIGLSVLFGAVFTGLSVLFLHWHVIRPISALERQMTRLAGSEESDARLETGQRDEIGRLAEAANRLLERAGQRRREAEAQRELVEGIFNSATEGIIAYAAVRDRTGAIVDFRIVENNRAAERICQAQPGELAGRKARELFPKIEEVGVFALFVRVASSRESETLERAFDGGRIKGWLRVAVVPWNDGVVVTFDDITERKRRERELAQTYAEIDRFNEAMIGREERVIEMKREVNALRARLGLEPAYKETHERD